LFELGSVALLLHILILFLRESHLQFSQDTSVFVDCMRALDRQANPIALLKQIYRSGLSFVGELIDTIEDLIQENDLVVCSYIFPHFKVLCDRYKVPFATITFCHSVIPAKDVTPDLVPKLHGFPASIQYLWNSFWWCLPVSLRPTQLKAKIRPVPSG
jgi:hypothetical protein